MARIDGYLDVSDSNDDRKYPAQRLIDVLDGAAGSLASSSILGYSLSDTSKGGAPPNGVDDTATIAAVHASCLAAGGVPMICPAGSTYIYNGSGLDNGSVRSGGILGAGPHASQITITQDSASLYKPSQRYDRFVMKDITISGGFGAYRNTNTGPQVGEKIKFDNVEFVDYTGAAIASETNDSPYLTVTRCYFKALDYVATMGISWTGHCDNMYLAANAFVKNRVSLKLVWDPITGKAPVNGFIFGNDFIRLATHTGGDAHAINIWLVPAPAANAAGYIYVDGNKFGSENLLSGDQWILFADEDTGSGSDHATYFPDEATSSTGTIFGFVMGDRNTIANAGTAAVPTVESVAYSTSVDVRHSRFAGTNRAAPPLYMLKLKDDPAPSASANALAASRYNQSNIFGPFLDDVSGLSASPIRGSNYPGMGILEDSLSQHAGRHQHIEARPGGQNPSGYVDLLTTRIGSYNTSGVVTKTPVTDSQGGTDASELSLANGAMARATLTTFISGEPCWISLDIRSGQSGSPLANITTRLRVGPGGAGNFHFDRVGVEVPPNNQWGYRRFFFVPREAVACEIQFINASGATGTIQIGRVNVYHAREPISHGPVLLRQPDGTIVKVGIDNNGLLTGVTQPVAVTGSVTDGVLYWDGANWVHNLLVQANIASGLLLVRNGSGSPETVVTAPVGSLYTRTNGGANTTLYVKESGSGNTGWVAK